MNTLENTRRKITERADLSKLIALWRFQSQTIVFTNGCFDILHRGHIEYLSAAADLGNILIIGLNTDASVKRLKGEGRPVQDEQSRALALASLRFVTAVVLFDEDTPYELIKSVQPDVLVKGGDYTEDTIVGADIVRARGGKVVTIPLTEGYSTSGILNSL
ncbi:MAG: D-glycero-beta-D-manno-heptose 1-phosphate adenylyltransferase [Bacteroidales bacterium]|nr:D-glycero-beta-D-manno-heptose 1-phosphate adenylyltransferase [Bacteroidales bacterium]